MANAFSRDPDREQPSTIRRSRLSRKALLFTVGAVLIVQTSPRPQLQKTMCITRAIYNTYINTYVYNNVKKK